MDLLSWIRLQKDRALGFALIVAGAAALLAGYLGVSGSPYMAEGLAYIVSGGIGGLFLLGAGATLLVSADLRDEWRKLDRIEAALRGEPRPDNGQSVLTGDGDGALATRRIAADR